MGDHICGRFIGFRKLDQLEAFFPIDMVNAEPAPNYNIAPTHQVLAIASLDGRNVLDKYRWGLIPFWAKDVNIGYKMINARSKTLAGNPAFRGGL